MPWIISITLDEGREDVGSITATYADEKGTIIDSYSARAETSDAGIEKFMAKANAHLAAVQKKEAKEVELSARAVSIANKAVK